MNALDMGSKEKGMTKSVLNISLTKSGIRYTYSEGNESCTYLTKKSFKIELSKKNGTENIKLICTSCMS